MNAAASGLELEITIDEIVLLEPPQPLADLPSPHGSHAVHCLQLAMARPDDRIEAPEVAHDVPDDGVRKPGDPGEHAVPARLHAQVERVRVPAVPEQSAAQTA